MTSATAELSRSPAEPASQFARGGRSLADNVLHFTKSLRGKSQKVSTPPSVIRIDSEIAIPQSSSQMPGMKCKVMPGCRTVSSMGRSEMVRSPQSGG